ncbi:MAG TPA: molybdopterin converting factor subunit 1 [Vulgatibacter sp.]|nr:molybdopterin converting factor subunit 1 [Vulgatibacter sp.]
MEIRVLYFAAAREAVGVGDETVEVPDGLDVAALMRLLAERHPGAGRVLGRCRLAVDRALANPSDPVPAGAEVALIPPVSGGSA